METTLTKLAEDDLPRLLESVPIEMEEAPPLTDEETSEINDHVM